jgi:hypothetical protein
MATSAPKPDSDVADAQAEFKRYEETFAENYQAALDDLRFGRLGDQWPSAVKRQRELDNRPCLTINRLPAFIRQVVNDARQNRPAITVHPVDSNADVHTAQILDGLMRHIEQSSDADVAYDTAMDFAASGGFGFIGINTRYATDDGFEQDICIERKANPLAIYGDPDSTAADSSDWNGAFELETLTEAAFKKRWKGAEAVSFEKTLYTESDQPDEMVTVACQWTREKSVRVITAVGPPSMDADPQKLMTAASLFDPNRLTLDIDVYKKNKDLFDALGMTPQGQTREVPTYKVTQRILSGAEELDRTDWAGTYIPLIPVYGEEIHVEGKRYFRSLIRDAKDAQQMFNYWRTASTELVALAPKAPFIGAKGSFVTDADKWATANTETHAYIEYDPVPNGSPPERQAFAGPPAGALQEAMNAQDDIKSILGLFDASMGAPSNETSGRAILMRQREGDVSTFHIVDNLSRAIRHCGRVILDLVPHVYSTPRLIRIIGADGNAHGVQIGPQQAAVSNQTAAPPMPAGIQPPPDPLSLEEAACARVYDLTLGKYDLTVTAGPSFTTRREEAANQMLALIQAYPQAAPILGDLMAKNLDWPGADEISDRLQKLLPPQLQGDNPMVDQLRSQAQTLAQMLGQAKAQIAAMQADQSLDAKRVQIEAFDAETARMKALAPKGVAFAPETQQAVEQVVMSTLMQLLNDPDMISGQGQQPPMQPTQPQPGPPLAA